MAIIGDSFENLEQIPSQVVKQVVKLPKDIVGGAVKSVMGKSDDSSGKPKIDPLTGLEIPSKQQIQQLQKQEKKRKQAAIPHAQQIIQDVQKPPSAGGQIPKYVAGKPGFDKEQAVKQMTGEALPTKKELPPPVAAVKRKFSTGERRGGVSG